MVRYLFSLALIALVSLSPGDAQEITHRPEITGSHGVVAAGRHYSVEAGIRMIQQGGNAVDAGAAAVFAASVVEISHFGFGGEAPTLICMASRKKVVAINGQGPAPLSATPAAFQEAGRIDTNGPRAATVPAVLDTMVIALQHFGTMRLEQVLQPAIELADGFVMYPFLERYLESERKASEPYPDTMKTYYPGGEVIQAGRLFRQPNLAATFRAIVSAEKTEYARTRDRVKALQAGRDLFYRGEIARRIVDSTRGAGGLLSLEDMSRYKGRIEEPVSTTFTRYKVFKCGFWNQGPVLLQALNILEGFNLKEMGLHSADYIHTVAEAIKLAYDDRDTYYGDPDFVQVPAEGLLSKDYADARRRLISREKAEMKHRPGDPYAFDSSAKPPARRYYPSTPQKPSDNPSVGDTTCVNVVDKDGNLFSSTPSSGWLLGGAFIAGDTGVPMSNRMQAFTLAADSPNVLAGGKRPRTTLSPTIVFRDGKPLLAVSTPGGDSQDQQILNVLLNIFVFDMGIQMALEAPRFNSQHMFSTFGVHEDKPGVLEVENRIPAEVIRVLRERGHRIQVRSSWGISTGVTVAGIDPESGTLRGGADVRRERYVFGW